MHMTLNRSLQDVLILMSEYTPLKYRKGSLTVFIVHHLVLVIDHTYSTGTRLERALRPLGWSEVLRDSPFERSPRLMSRTMMCSGRHQMMLCKG